MAGSGRFKGLVPEEPASADPPRRERSTSRPAIKVSSRPSLDVPPRSRPPGSSAVASRPAAAPPAKLASEPARAATPEPGFTVVDDDTPLGHPTVGGLLDAVPDGDPPMELMKEPDAEEPGERFTTVELDTDYQPEEADRVRARAKLAELIRVGRMRGASDVHVVAGLPPALRLGGEIVALSSPPNDRRAMTRFVLGMISPLQRTQFDETKELCYSIHDGEAGRVRITVYVHAGIPELSIRLCTPEIPKASQLGLPPILDDLARKSQGLILITGPTGSGKTTTLNYMVDLINRDRRCKIVMIEDPVEFIHRPQRSIIVQQEVHSDTLSFSRALVHVLRQNPDVIAIGEMRELETISTALTAAETGHLVLATLHTPNAVQTIERIAAVFPAGQQAQINLQLASSLQGVITQQLIPRADKQGRALAVEVMTATAAVRANIRENKPHHLYNVIEMSGREGMITMDQSLLDLYHKGLITYDAAVSRANVPERFTRGSDGSRQARASLGTSR